MLNKVILIGRLTDDPELKHLQNGTAICSFTVAVARSYVKSGEQRQTDFLDVVAWNKLAEFIAKWFAKGRPIIVVGELQSRLWTDKAGAKRKSIDVVANEIRFAEAKKEPMKPEEMVPVEENIEEEDLPW